MNKTGKKSIALLLILCMAFTVLAGCGKTEPAATEAKEAVTEAAETAAATEAAETETQTAEAGNIVLGDVVIPTQEEALKTLGLTKVPQKVLCTSYNTSMLAYTLGIEITATVDTNRPFPDELRALPNIGVVTGSTVFDFEQIISLSGDLVLGDSYFEKKLAPTLTEQGVSSYFVDAGTYNALQDAVALIGAAFGKTDKAVELITLWQETAQRLNEETKDLEHPTILCMTEGQMRTHTSYTGSLFEILNIKNAADEMGYTGDVPPFLPTEIEKILAVDPDMIIIPGGETLSKGLMDEVMTSPAWSSLSAVKNGKVIAVDDSMFGRLATMDCAEALQILKEAVYG